ncbi:MAG: DUF4214 domain-containing protein, partial [Planctomycetes bacterium]|nr:DUF4214 domain-containing protein [Planctomycetota bacterium]
PALGAVLPLGIPASALRVPPGAATSNAAAALGELLFFEKRISRDGSVSCASCHRPALGFTDGLARARGVGGALGARNTPTVLNRALSSAQFFDGRASSLEVQALGPIENPDEMNLPIPDAVARLATSATYRARFRAAFGRGPSRATLAAALAAFQRRLLSGGSRVDRWEAGQGGLTPREVRGRELFLGRARCVACHVGPNFTNEAFHNTASARSLSDRGRAAATGRASDEGRFKTPTLRDVSRTAPYLHDGSVGTLEEVIELYDRGGLRRSGRDVEIRALGLTPGEKADLAAFLRALDGPSTARQPPSLPTDVQFTAPLATPTEQWLDSVYQAYLGRVATGAERTDQVRALSAGRTPEQVVREVSTSPGALERKVEGLYRRYLNRLGDPGGVANYVAAAQSGRQRAALEVDFLLSAENRARRPGQVGWITGLYEDVLGRAPDAAGLAGHDAHLTANPNSRDSVARAFVRSGERHGRWVDAAYTDLLSRAPSASERADAVARLGQGEALEEVRVRLLTSLAP